MICFNCVVFFNIIKSGVETHICSIQLYTMYRANVYCAYQASRILVVNMNEKVKSNPCFSFNYLIRLILKNNLRLRLILAELIEPYFLYKY